VGREFQIELELEFELEFELDKKNLCSAPTIKYKILNKLHVPRNFPE